MAQSTDQTWLLEQDDQHRRHSQREGEESMAEMADALRAADRALVRLVHDRGVSVSLIAAAAEVPPSRMYGRLRQIEQRFADPAIIRLWLVREHIPPDARRIVIQHFLGGANVRELVEEHNYPRPWVYRTLATYRRWAEQVTGNAITSRPRQRRSSSSAPPRQSGLKSRHSKRP